LTSTGNVLCYIWFRSGTNFWPFRPYKNGNKMLKEKTNGTTTLNVGNYKNNITTYESMGAKFVGAEWFDWDQLEISDRQYQTRVADADLGHIATLAADIENIGIQTLPIVEFDPVKVKYRVLSGFHRMLALHKNNDNPESAKNKYPAIVLEFQDSIKRWEFLQHCNNHRPSKSHGKSDAVAYIKKMQSMGHFDKYGKDEKAIQNQVYQMLTKHYPRIKTSTKASIFEEALNFKTKKVKTWTPSEAKVEVQRIHGKPHKSGAVEGDACYITSDYNVVRKSIYVKSTDRANQIHDKTSSSRLDIKLVTWAPKQYNIGSGIKDLKAFRKNALKDLTVMNNMVWGPSKVSLVTEVDFLHQALTGEEKESIPIKYKWSSKNKKFNLV